MWVDEFVGVFFDEFDFGIVLVVIVDYGMVDIFDDYCVMVEDEGGLFVDVVLLVGEFWFCYIYICCFDEVV